MFKILCLDGGGARGYFSAYMLKQIEKEYNIKINEYFDLIVGTSTGSIIAAAISVGIDIEEILELYLKENNRIFSKRVHKGNVLSKLLNDFAPNQIFNSIFDNNYFKFLINKKFENKEFKDSVTNLMIPITSIDSKKPIVSKSWIDTNELNLKDSIIASSSAPIFFNPHTVKGKIYADGSIWANNPSLLAISEAIDFFGEKLDDIKILSIGTGESLKELEIDKEDDKWGLIKWSKILVPVAMQSNVLSTTLISEKLLKDRFFRINFKTNEEIALDILPNSLVDNCQNFFIENKEKINDFFAIKEIEIKQYNALQKIVKKLFRI